MEVYEHPQGILEDAMDAGGVPEKLRGHFRRRLARAILRDTSDVMELVRAEQIQPIPPGEKRGRRNGL